MLNTSSFIANFANACANKIANKIANDDRLFNLFWRNEETAVQDSLFWAVYDELKQSPRCKNCDENDLCNAAHDISIDRFREMSKEEKIEFLLDRYDVDFCEDCLDYSEGLSR